MASWLLVIPLGLALVKSRPEVLGLAPDGAPPAESLATPLQAASGAEGRRRKLWAAPARAASGTVPSGEAERHDGGPAAAPERESWHVGEALRTRQFWIMGVATAIPSMLITGMVFHQFSYFLEQGRFNTRYGNRGISVVQLGLAKTGTF